MTVTVTAALVEYDKARARYRRAYDRGYAMSERGDAEQAQKILDKANAELAVAKAAFEAATREEA